MASNNTVPRLKIRKFNPEILENRRLSGSPPTIVIVGKRGTGKSTLITDILWHMRLTPMFIVMSGTEEGNGFYKKYFHPLCIHGDYKKDIVSNLIREQKHNIKACMKNGIDPNNTPSLSKGLLLDDCGYDKKIFKQKDIRQIFMNGRHWKLCFIISLQYVVDIPPDLRTNVDFVFCLRENIVDNQQKLYKYFFGNFAKFSHFKETFEKCTSNYECLVLDNTSKSTNIEDCVYYYKGKPNREYKIGSKELWDYLDSRYQHNDDDDDDEMPTNVVVKKTGMSRSPIK